MSAWVTGEVPTRSKLVQKTIFVGTGAEINALTTSTATFESQTLFPGQLAFCTSTGSGFTANHLYFRNSANNAWLEIMTSINTDTLTNKSIDGGSNSISNLGSSTLSNLAVTQGKLAASAFTIFGTASSNASFTTSSTSYVDVTSLTVTVTANGSRSGLITNAVSSIENNTLSSSSTCAITDSTPTTKAEVIYVGEATATIKTPLHIMAVETAPSSGSLTRKLRLKASANTAGLNTSALTKGSIMYVMEVL